MMMAGWVLRRKLFAPKIVGQNTRRRGHGEDAEHLLGSATGGIGYDGTVCNKAGC